MDAHSLQRLLLAIGLACGCAPTNPPNLPANPLAKLRQANQKIVVDNYGSFYGTITQIGPNWFELGAGWKGRLELDGKPDEGNDKPRRIPTGATKPGGNPDGIGNADTYLLGDLKVGDVVSVDTYLTSDREVLCAQIQILRRPGGTIPQGTYMGLRNTNDTNQLEHQAEQDWEEKGVPIPTKYLDSDGRYPWTNPPYPQVAPQPREVVAKP